MYNVQYYKIHVEIGGIHYYVKKSSKIFLCTVVAIAGLTVNASAATHTQNIYYNQQGSTSAWKYASYEGTKGYFASSKSESTNILNIKMQYKDSQGAWISTTVFNYNLAIGKSYSAYKTFSKGYYRVVLNPDGAFASGCVATVNMQY